MNTEQTVARYWELAGFEWMLLKSLSARRQYLLKLFQALPDWEHRYKLMMDIGRKAPTLNVDEKEEKFLIKGCQSQVWIIPCYDSIHHVLYFKADSDSLLVKGLVSLLVTVYHGQSPEEIFQEKGQIIKDLNIIQNLSMGRGNGVASMMKQLQLYAFVYKKKEI